MVANNFRGSEVLSWNVTAGFEQWRQNLGIKQTCAVLWAADGQKVLTLDRDGTLREHQLFNGIVNVQRATSPNEPWRNPTGNLPMALCDGLGRPRLAVLATDGQTIHVLDPARNYSAVDLRGHLQRVTGLAGNPATSQLASVSLDGTLRIWDLIANREKHALRSHQGPVKAVVCSTDGKRVLTCGQDGTVRVWDPHGGIELLTVKVAEKDLSTLALSSNGRQLAVGQGNEVIVLGSPR